MDDPDANVIFIHTPKANDLAAWMLQAAIFIFFCLGVFFMFVLLKIANEVGKALENKQETAEPENNRNPAIMIYGNIPLPGGLGQGQVDIYFANGGSYTYTPPRLYSTGHPSSLSLQSRKSAYYGLPSEDPSLPSFALKPNQFGIPSAFHLPSGDNAKPNNDTPSARTGVHDKKNLVCGTRHQLRYGDTSTNQGTEWTFWRAPKASLKVYNNPVVAETPVAVMYQGMPRHRPLSALAARPSTYRLTPSSPNKIETPSNHLPTAAVVRHRNLSDWSDTMENMNKGGVGTPFAEYYSYSRRP